MAPLWTFLLVVWALLLLDGFGAVLTRLNPATASWYGKQFPSIAAQFPMSGWVWVYFGMALVGFITALLGSRRLEAAKKAA
jgi:hypothetical protein